MFNNSPLLCHSDQLGIHISELLDIHQGLVPFLVRDWGKKNSRKYMRLWHEYTKNTILGKNALCLKRQIQGSHTKHAERVSKLASKRLNCAIWGWKIDHLKWLRPGTSDKCGSVKVLCNYAVIVLRVLLSQYPPSLLTLRDRTENTVSLSCTKSLTFSSLA